MHLTFTTTAAIGLASLVGGCSLLTPEDSPPRIEQFTTSPVSAKFNEPLTFSVKASDDIGLEDIVVQLPDTAYAFKPQGQRFFETSFQRAFNAPGVKQGTAAATDAKRQTGTASVQFSVADALPPEFKNVSFNGAEGDTLRKPISDVVTDPQGKPFASVQVKSNNAPLTVAVQNDKILCHGVIENVNGTFYIAVTATNADGKTGWRDYPVVLDARDIISGFVKDVMEGQYATSKNPALSMTSGSTNNLSGWVKFDNGVKTPVDVRGYFKSPKLIPGNHVVEAFITNGTDSSLVATYDLGSGDQSFNPGVNTNAGTGWDLAMLRNFYYVFNFRRPGIPEIDNKLKGIDLKHAKDYSYWITQKDTLLGSDRCLKMTPEEQDLVVSEIMKYYEWLPESMRPNIYKAKLNEDLPAIPYLEAWKPKNGILLVLKKDPTQSGFPGNNATFDENEDGKLEAAMAMFRIPFIYNVQMRELAAPLFCVNDDWSGIYFGKSPFDSQHPIDSVNASAVKAIYLNALFPQGSDFNKHWKMPY